MSATTKIKFFTDAAKFRRWLVDNHQRQRELVVGYYKKETGRASMTWSESVDQALCFGWIDGVRRRIDDVSYSIRFTPRKPTSIWSQVNIDKVAKLTEQGLMHPAGLVAFDKRIQNRSGVYSYEQRSITFAEPYLSQFQSVRAAWNYFEQQLASYRKAACWWVLSAKREETRAKRLAQLIAHSVKHQRIPQFLANRTRKKGV